MWEEYVNEHMVITIAIHLSRKYFDSDLTNRRTECDYNNSIKKVGFSMSEEFGCMVFVKFMKN